MSIGIHPIGTAPIGAPPATAATPTSTVVPIWLLTKAVQTMAIRNQALTINFEAYDTNTNTFKTGDSANITLRIIKDGGAPAAPTNAISEPDATNMPGTYELTLTATEMDADFICIDGKSSTTNVIVVGVKVATESGDLAVISAAIAALNDITAAEVRTEMDANSTQLAAIVADTNELQGDWTNAGRLDTILDNIKTDTTGIIADTGTIIPADIAAVQADTDNIQTRLPAALVGGRIDANMGAISGNATSADNLEASTLGLHVTTVATSASSTEFTLTAGESRDDAYNGRVVVVYNSSTRKHEVTPITDYVGATKTVTVDLMTGALGVGDSIVIV